MRILAIDPGPEKSGWLVWDTEKPGLGVGRSEGTIDDNAFILGDVVGRIAADAFVIEMVASYGMAVGKDVFETVFAIGRFYEIAVRRMPCHRIFRKDVKLHFCGSSRAKDANIRQALIDRFGGKDRAIGGKKCPKCKGKTWVGRNHDPCPGCNATGWKYPPGPLKGIVDHLWAALALALYYQDTHAEAPEPVPQGFFDA